MDMRKTLVVHATFAQQLQELKETKQKASLLIDEQGLTREEGFITQITEGENDTLIYLDNGKRIPLHRIVALNGIFLSDYSEC